MVIKYPDNYSVITCSL